MRIREQKKCGSSSGSDTFVQGMEKTYFKNVVGKYQYHTYWIALATNFKLRKGIYKNRYFYILTDCLRISHTLLCVFESKDPQPENEADPNNNVVDPDPVNTFIK